MDVLTRIHQVRRAEAALPYLVLTVGASSQRSISDELNAAPLSQLVRLSMQKCNGMVC
jgi:hypothetical protein